MRSQLTRPVAPQAKRYLAVGLSCALALAATGLAGCSGGGGGGGGSSTASSSGPSAPVQGSGRGEIGAAGGTVSLSSGPAAGSNVVAPGGALAATTTLTIDPTTDVVTQGAVPVGPAVRFGPAGTAFASPAVVTVPFDASRIPAGSALADLIVLRREDGTGAIADLPPVSIDAGSGLVSAATGSFSTFQAAVRPVPLPPAPSIAVTPTALDFGAVTAGASIDLTFSVSNVGGGTLAGTATASTPFSIVAGATYSLGSAASSLVTVRFSPGGAGTFTSSVVLPGGGGASVAVTGQGVIGTPPLSGAGFVSPRVGAFGAAGIAGSVDLAFTVSCTSSQPLAGAAQVAGPFSVVGPASYSLAQGQTAVLTIRFSPSGPGAATGTATFAGGVSPSALAFSGFGGAPLGAGPEFAAGEVRDVALARIDGDDVLDAVAGQRASTALVLHGDGMLGFSLAAAPLAGVDQDRCVAADLDGDGFTDVACADAARGTITVLWGDAATALTATTTIDLVAAGAGPGGADGLAATDLYIWDATRDLVVARAGAGAVSVLRTSGRTFTALANVSVTSPADIASADLDGDGVPDLAVATGAAGGVALFHGDNGGGFTSLGAASGSGFAARVAIADLDRRGRLDVAVLDTQAELVASWSNDGAGGLARLADAPAGPSPTAFAVADLDGDGESDFAVALAGGAGPALLKNAGRAAGFSRMPAPLVAGAQRAVAAGDLDGDGVTDLLLARSLTPGASDLVALRGLAPRFTRGIDLLGVEVHSPSDSVVFVLEASSLMDWGTDPYIDYQGNPAVGTRFDRAKSALARAITTLPPWVEFHVYTFDCDVHSWRPSPVTASLTARADAVAWLLGATSATGAASGPSVARTLADVRSCRTFVIAGRGGADCSSLNLGTHLRTILVANTQQAEIHTLGVDVFGSAEQYYRAIAKSTGGVFLRVP